MPDRSPSSDRTLILVAEGEPAVRAVVVETLEDEGFEVIETSTADHAAAILQARTDIRVGLPMSRCPGTSTASIWLGSPEHYTRILP